jgi:homoserine kinase type II
MARKTPLSLDEARALGAAYGLDVARVAEVPGGSVNSNFELVTAEGERFFLRVYEEQDESGARRELALVQALVHAGVPTPAPLQRAGEEPLLVHAQKPVALFPWVEGSIVCQHGVTPAHAERVGRALARVHVSGAAVDHVGRFTPKDLEARLDRVSAEAPTLGGECETIRAALRAAVRERNPELPRGVIHGDLFRDNVLWQKGEIAALIDFESASRGAFVYDLAVTLSAWCFGDRFDIELVRALGRGYESVRELSGEESAALPNEASIAALRFASTRLTDYTLTAPPGQPPLRDYRRFLARFAEIRAGALEL